MQSIVDRVSVSKKSGV